ncbi:tyrosine-type recombinase/integrase [Planomonospora venezuelensis]|uniref:Site-specific recombinase XerD n=1 Tax=Planomonospora venezuelensis TaxID=1999 RepID=A0A841CVJ5_PLAVE|nr:tyrosine-type recombinase/integrase [Planomonospora venezuelensis]MBB5960853.1 site-specific recombinase XerD [Planomonospora venezuelensis]GIN01086.1 integrase [Planomonospora venezuelensis]
MTELVPAPLTPSAVVVPAVDARVTHSAADLTLSPFTRVAVIAGVPGSTRRAYASDWETFSVWCESVGRVALPATAQTVTEYVAHLTVTPSAKTGRPLAPSSIERSLAAIRTRHNAADVEPPQTKAARKVLSGYRERLALTKDPAAKTRKADAAEPDALRTMLETLDRTTLAGKRDAVALLLGYACAARISELVALDIVDVRETADGLLVTVYRRKIKKFTEVAIPYGRIPATCPVRAVRALLGAMGEAGRTSGPLLVRIDRHGRIAPPMTRKGKVIGDPQGRMTAEAVAEIVGRIAASAGLEGRWTGHSLRRGFATAARRAGATLERIGRHGGWADGSTALLGYLEEGDRWTDNPVTGL